MSVLAQKFFAKLESLPVIVVLQIGVCLQALGYASFAIRDGFLLSSETLAGLGASAWVVDAWPVGLGLAFAGLAIGIAGTKDYRWPLVLGLLVLFLSAYKAVSVESYAALVMPSHAARYLPPLCLAFFLRQQGEKRQLGGNLIGVLRVAIGLTFIGHGIKCVLHSGSMLKLIAGFFGSFELEISQTAAYLLLDTIGIVDIIAGVWLIVSPHFAPALYMAGWAFIAANSRLFVGGIGAFDEILIRGCYYMTPLAIAVSLRRAPVSVRSRKPILPILGSVGQP